MHALGADQYPTAHIQRNRGASGDATLSATFDLIFPTCATIIALLSHPSRPPAMSQPTTHLYRSILRELRLAVCCPALVRCIESLLIPQSRKSRITRNPTVHTHIREVVAAGPTDLNKTLLEIRDFLKSTRIHAVSVIPCILALGVGGGSQRLNHRPMDCGIASGIAALNVPLLILQELLKRYNPIADMTEEERIHATARRVGLDTPQEYKKD